MSSGAGEKLSVHLISRKEEYDLGDGGTVEVPSTMSRLELSTLVNALLRLDSTVPFDFLIQNAFLRQSLRDYCIERNISNENVLDIEFLPAVTPPELTASLPHDDWVSGLCFHSSYSFSGSYDGHIRIWNSQNECTVSREAHRMPIKTLSCADKDGRVAVASGSLDASISVWRADTTFTSLELAAKCLGHSGSVDCSGFSPSGIFLSSGSADGTIRLWDLAENLVSNTMETVKTSKGRRTLRSAPKKMKIDPVVHDSIVLEGHLGPLSSLVYASEASLISGSFDRTVRFWDIPSQSLVDSLTVDSAVLDISEQKGSLRPLIASGHTDRSCLLLDPRVPAPRHVVRKLMTHDGWVSTVSWHPENQNLLLTGSYDTTLCLWDLRAATPLYSIRSHSEKVLCSNWESSTRFGSGSADATARLHSVDTSVNS